MSSRRPGPALSKKLVTIRKAELRDVPTLFRIVNRYAADRVMLPRTLAELYESAWEFTVAEEDGRVVGCGALKIYSQELAEIRSLCVEPGETSRGLGSALTEQLLREANRCGLKTLFALTVAPGFFRKCGFRQVPRENFPLKIWRDCLRCEKFACCDEKTVVMHLTAQRKSQAPSRAETAEVPT